MLQMFVLALSLYNTWNRGVFLLCKITNLLIYSFEIYQAQTFNQYEEASDYKLVFKKHTATFTDAYHAVYEGQQYTLHFECGTNTGYITISGFSEVIPDGSQLCNTEWLQVS